MELFPYLSSCILILQINHCVSTEVDVLILGAGYAGMGAARTFYQQNVTNFLVLEAKNYIGGRAHSVKIGDQTVELGAGWIHNIEENNIVYRLAKKYRLRTAPDPIDYENIIFRHGDTGHIYNNMYVKNVAKRLSDAIKQSGHIAVEMINRGHEDISGRVALGMVGWRNNLRIKAAMEYFVLDMENACAPNMISASKWNNVADGGMVTVADDRGFTYPILQEIKPYANKFLLNTEVTKVKRLKNKKYLVTIKDGRKYWSNHVIVTFSSGVLLAETVKFSPLLPLWKRKALKKVPMTHFCKFFFKFPYQFWDDIKYIMLATKDRGQFMYWENYNQADIFDGKNILLAMIAGRKCHKKHFLTDKEIISEAMITLRKVYRNAPSPLEMVRNAWSRDPQFMGAYSKPEIGITDHDFRKLALPIHNSLWFASEYISLEHFTFTHGAYETGRAAALKISSAL